MFIDINAFIKPHKMTCEFKTMEAKQAADANMLHDVCKNT